MRFTRATAFVAVCVLLLLGLPAFADSWTTFSNPGDDSYIANTTNFGGGDGSGGTISALGPFTYSNPQTEFNVPNSWASWNSPPFVESSTPNVLFNAGFFTLHIDVSGAFNTTGFELEPDLFQVETVSVTYHSSTGDSFTVTRDVNGSAGALLFAVQDDTAGATITSIDIDNTVAGDDFATAQWRAGNSGPAVPEPGTMLMLGSGLLGMLGVIRRKVNL